MAGCALVYAATDDAEMHRAIAVEARGLGILLNVADVPELCSFITPAIVKQGSLKIAISTGGASPAFAARLRRSLEAQFGIEYAHALRILGGARKYLKSQTMDPAERSNRLKALAESELLDALGMHDVAALERIVATCLGHGVGLATLGIDAASLGEHGELNASH
jgi:precorrin-2 dehydrogenase/sirohydrochlorin ferrochelatase